MEFSGSEKYYLNPEIGMIVNMAVRMEKPLLLTGEPGTGKTQLAFEVSQALNMPIEVLRAKSTIKGEEVCYTQRHRVAIKRCAVRSRWEPTQSQ